MRPPIGKEFVPTRKHRWTDLAVVVGPIVTWVQDDFSDLYRAYPEVFLGYRVLLLPAQSLPEQTRGREVAKLLVMEGDYSWKNRKLVEETEFELEYLQGTKVEHWRVHRGLGISRVA